MKIKLIFKQSLLNLSYIFLVPNRKNIVTTRKYPVITGKYLLLRENISLWGKKSRNLREPFILSLNEIII